MPDEEAAAPEAEEAVEEVADITEEAADEEEAAEALEEEESREDLYKKAQALDIEGRSKMDKDELAEAVAAEVAARARAEAEAGFQPSQTDLVQQRMNAGVAEGEAVRRSSIARNRERRRQQHEALARTNRPGPVEEPMVEDEEE